MSNELSTPKIITCPSDSRTPTGISLPATNFNSIVNPNNTTTGITYANATTVQYISYFVSGDANESNPQMLLSGDYNIGSAAPVNTAAGTNTFTGGQLWNGTMTGVNVWAWGSTSCHLKVGNTAITDGSVQQYSVNALQQALLNSTNASPAPFGFNFPQ